MESYCLECRKNTENIDPKVSASSNGRVMILSKCAMCGSMKKKQGLMDISMILVLIMILLQLMILKVFTSI